jgi:transposase
VIDSHKQEKIIEVLKQQPLEVRERVEEVSVDMWGGFPKVVQEVFPNALVIFDRFHVMKAVNDELNKIRKQVSIKIKSSKFILLKNGVALRGCLRSQRLCDPSDHNANHCNVDHCFRSFR